MYISNINKIDIKIIRYFLVFLILNYTLYFLNYSASIFLFINGTFAVFFFGWVLIYEYRTNVIKITPMIALFIIPFLMLGVAAIYHSFVYIDQDYAILGPSFVSTKSIIQAYLMFNTGLFFQFLGLLIFKPQQVRLNTFIERRKNLRIFRYFVISFIISKVVEQTMQLGILYNFISLIPLSIIIFIAIRDKRNQVTSYIYKRNSVVFGSIILFISNLIFLSKTNLVFTIVPIFLFYLIHSTKVNRIKLFTITAIVVITYFFFIQPFVTNARYLTMRENKDASFSFLSSYILSGDFSIPVESYRTTNNQAIILLERLFELNAPAYIYELTERTGFQNGKTLSHIAISLIPRIFWPSKPEVTQGQWFASDNFGLDKVNIGMLIVGELYWNFGYLGIIFGSFLIGISLGFLWRVINPHLLKNFFYFNLYFYLLQSAIGGAEFSAVFIGIIQLIVAFYLIRLSEIFVIQKK